MKLYIFIEGSNLFIGPFYNTAALNKYKDHYYDDMEIQVVDETEKKKIESDGDEYTTEAPKAKKLVVERDTKTDPAFRIHYCKLLRDACNGVWDRDQLANQLSNTASEQFGIKTDLADLLYGILNAQGTIPLEAMVGICIGFGLLYEHIYDEES